MYGLASIAGLQGLKPKVVREISPHSVTGYRLSGGSFHVKSKSSEKYVHCSVLCMFLFIIRPHCYAQHKMQPILTVVLVTSVDCDKRAEPSAEMPFWVWILVVH